MELELSTNVFVFEGVNAGFSSIRWHCFNDLNSATTSPISDSFSPINDNIPLKNSSSEIEEQKYVFFFFI
jgi:hypothetical protein